jgi:hypothetical protein
MEWNRLLMFLQLTEEDKGMADKPSTAERLISGRET